MKIAEKKRMFFQTLNEYLLPKGYKGYLSGGDPSYVLNNKDIVISFFFNFFTAGDISPGLMKLTHKDVEGIILSIGMPHNSLEAYKGGGKYNLTTVNDRIPPLSLNSVIIKNEAELILYAQAQISYFENQGADFIRKYEYLPNVLKEMNRLEADGKKWKDILFGMGDAYFRALIISKLCNDPGYSKKYNQVDLIFNEPDEWRPYWEKLKELLPTIEAKYNL